MNTPLVCPHCKAVMNATTGIDEKGLHDSIPKAGDYSLCAGCLSFLRFDENVQLVSMNVEDVANMPDEERITLVKIRKMVEEERLRREFPPDVDKDFAEKCNLYMDPMLKDRVLPELQGIFGDDLEIVVIIKKGGGVGAYCGGKKMNSVKAVRLLRDGAERMMDLVKKEFLQ